MSPAIDPEREAMAVIEAAKVVVPPVNLRRIIELWPELNVTQCDMDGDGAFVDLGDQGGCIFLKRAATRERTRFTLAHELGHFVLRTKAGVLSDDEIERWCDRFAASLLMPRDAINRHLDCGQSLALAVFAGPTVFDVSIAAFRQRVAEVASLAIWIIELEASSLEIAKTYCSRSSPLSNFAANDIQRLVESSLRKADSDKFFSKETGCTLSGLRTLRRGGHQSWLVVASGAAQARLRAS